MCVSPSSIRPAGLALPGGTGPACRGTGRAAPPHAEQPPPAAPAGASRRGPPVPFPGVPGAAGPRRAGPWAAAARPGAAPAPAGEVTSEGLGNGKWLPRSGTSAPCRGNEGGFGLVTGQKGLSRLSGTVAVRRWRIFSARGAVPRERLPGASSWAGDLLERKSAIRFSEPKERFYCRQVQRSACFSVSTSHFICDVGLSRPTSLEIEGFAGPQSSSTYSYFSFPAVRQGRYFPAQAAMIHQLIKTQRCAAARCQLK